MAVKPEYLVSNSGGMPRAAGKVVVDGFGDEF